MDRTASGKNLDTRGRSAEGTGSAPRRPRPMARAAGGRRRHVRRFRGARHRHARDLDPGTDRRRGIAAPAPARLSADPRHVAPRGAGTGRAPHRRVRRPAGLRRQRQARLGRRALGLQQARERAGHGRGHGRARPQALHARRARSRRPGRPPPRLGSSRARRCAWRYSTSCRRAPSSAPPTRRSRPAITTGSS